MFILRTANRSAKLNFAGPIKKKIVRYTGAKCDFGTGGESEHPDLASPGPGLLFRPRAQNPILRPCSEKYIYRAPNISMGPLQIIKNWCVPMFDLFTSYHLKMLNTDHDLF